MNHIQHAGVKGMKWGVRKDRKKSSGHKRDKTTFFHLSDSDKRQRESFDRWNKKVSNRHSMSTRDIRRYTNRLRLENQLAEELRKSAKYRPQTGMERMGDSVNKIGRRLLGVNINKYINGMISTKRASSPTKTTSGPKTKKRKPKYAHEYYS